MELQEFIYLGLFIIIALAVIKIVGRLVFRLIFIVIALVIAYYLIKSMGLV